MGLTVLLDDFKRLFDNLAKVCADVQSLCGSVGESRDLFDQKEEGGGVWLK